MPKPNLKVIDLATFLVDMQALHRRLFKNTDVQKMRFSTLPTPALSGSGNKGISQPEGTPDSAYISL